MNGRRLPAALVVLTVGAWALEAAVDVVPHRHLTDLPVYEDAARAIADGRVPYRDLPLEYPPLAAGLFVVARALPFGYATAFSLLMLAALCATVLATVAIARSLGFAARRQAISGGVVALVPLLLGDFVATRFDLAVAAAAAWTLWAAVTERFRLAWTLLAVAVALKLAPVVLVPLLVVWHANRRGGRSAAAGAGLAAAGAAATLLPFAVLAPAGVWRMFEYHLDRPLQIESLGASALLGLDRLAGLDVRIVSSYGSQNVVAAGSGMLAALSGAVAVAAVAAAAWTVRVRLRDATPAGRRGLLVAGAAATLAASVTAGKVLSPQFLVWLLPATLLVAGRRGRFALGTTVAALVATQLYFPVRYWELVAGETVPTAILVVRNALLVALVALVWPRSRPPERQEPAVLAPAATRRAVAAPR